jgi:hypothetical protein
VDFLASSRDFSSLDVRKAKVSSRAIRRNASAAWALVSIFPIPVTCSDGHMGLIDEPDKALHLHTGWAAGAGTEFAIAPQSVQFYNFPVLVHFAALTAPLPA